MLPTFLAGSPRRQLSNARDRGPVHAGEQFPYAIPQVCPGHYEYIWHSSDT